MNPTTHTTEGSASAPVLYMALELSIGIVALARKLLIALWRYLQITGRGP